MERTKGVIIYQLGRLDVGIFKDLLFGIEGKEYNTPLSTFAMKKHFTQLGYSPETVLLYPVSLPFNQSLFNKKNLKESCPDDCYKCLQWANQNPEDYLENPQEFFKSHPHTKDTDHFLIIHSLGTYNTAKGQISLSGNYSDIVLRILVDMLKRFLSKSDKERVIIDISSGYNVYVVALIEAARYLSVWLKLYEWIQQTPEVHIAFSEPVLPGLEGIKHRIYFDRLDVKAMFSSPVKYSDIRDYKLSRAIYPAKDKRAKKRRLQELLEAFVIIFSAIKNNSPLIIFQKGYHKKDDILAELKELLDYLEHRLIAQYDDFSGIDKNICIKSLLALGFYAGLVGIFQDKEILRVSEEGIELRRLRKSFEGVYQLFNLGLNDTILGNEVDKIFKYKGVTKGWEPLVKVLGYGDNNIQNPQKRNFFAHAGLESNITECKIEEKDGDREIYVRYAEKHEKIPQTWLKEAAE